MLKEAVALGRFQPLHDDHLAYLLNVKSRCNFMWVGIADFPLAVPDSFMTTIADRSASRANSKTFFERMQDVTSALLKAGVSHGEFLVTPFACDSAHGHEPLYDRVITSKL